MLRIGTLQDDPVHRGIRKHSHVKGIDIGRAYGDEEAGQLVGTAYERPAVRACMESVDESIMRDF